MPSPDFSGLRVGLIGFGKIAKFHIDALRSLKVDIIGCFNRSEQGRADAEAYGILPYDSLDALMKERPDGVISCVAFMNMHQHAKELLPYGCPVLMEKPAGITLAEYANICKRADSRHTPVMVAFNRRHYGVIQNALTHIRSNDATINSVLMEWSEPPQAVLDKRGQASLDAWTFANTSHGLDLLTYIAGNISKPSFTTKFGQNGFRTTVLTGVSEKNILTTFVNTWEGPSGWRLVIGTDKHQYRFGPLESGTIIDASRNETALEIPEHDINHKVGFIEQARFFLSNIQTRDFSPHDLASAAPAMHLCDLMTKELI